MPFQQLIIEGHCGKDPEMRYTPTGDAVTGFSVAVTDKWTNQDGSKGELTTWYKCSAWRRTAEIAAQYLAKGREVMIVGKLVPDKATGSPKLWTRQDGTSGASYEVKVDRLVLIGGRQDDEDQPQPQAPCQAPAQHPHNDGEHHLSPFDNDDIPF